MSGGVPWKFGVLCGIMEKIEDDPKNPKILETVWGAGYRLNK